MAKIYQGPIKNMHVKDLKVTSRGLEFALEDTIAVKNSLFYKNMFGRMINLEYDNFLATRQEAKDFVNETANSIIFVDYNELEYYDEINKKELKELKKHYKRR